MAGAKGTTIKDALSKWEKDQTALAVAQAEEGQEVAKVKASESKCVKLMFQNPPIDKMDASLSTLGNCEHLSLSSNMIEKIANLNGLKNLKILSLGRNLIKNMNGLEAVSDTLQELWVSYNNIEKLKGIQVLKKLKLLYMSNNQCKDWGEFDKLNQLPCLVELLFVGNPLHEKHDGEGDWRELVCKKLPNLKKLDGVPVITDTNEDEED